MNLTTISNSIKTLLETVSSDVVTLSDNPNISGIVNESEIFYALASGRFDSIDSVELELKINIASTLREAMLNNLISKTIAALHKKSIPNCRPIKFGDFEIFEPTSGKWRAVLTFAISAYITTNLDIDDGSTGKIQAIISEFDYECNN